jgi:hypothetical protein
VEPHRLVRGRIQLIGLQGAVTGVTLVTPWREPRRRL